MNQSEFELVSTIYDAVLSDEVLSGLAGRFAQAFDACSACLTWKAADGAATVISHAGLDPDMLALYEREFYAHDVWIHRAPPALYDKPTATDDYLPLASLERTAFYNEFLRPNGDLVHCVGALTRLDDGLANLGIQRTRGQGPFSPAETSRLEGLLGPLRKMFEIRTAGRRPAPGSEGLALLDQIGMGAVVVGPDMRMVWANERALERLKLNDGLIYTSRSGLTARVAGQEAELRACVGRACADGFGGAVRIRHAEDASDLIVRVIPYRPAPGARSGQALVFFREPTRMRSDAQELLSSSFKLSSAEAELALALAAGADVAQIAEARQVRVSTIRSQVASLMAKTGVQRQSQLVALVAKLSLSVS